MFIKDLVQEIQQLDKPYSELRIIVPSKRAIKYIREELASHITTPTFSPDILTISDWVKDNSPYGFAKPLELLIELFEVHLSLDKESNQTFDQFFNWGKSLLADFDEIDRYLVNPEEIYRDLRNIKEIESWSFNEDELSAGQTSFLEFWLKLKDYYSQLNQRLEAKGKCYAGNAFKKLALAPTQLNPDNRFVVFAGFNALSLAEEQIMRYFVQQKQGKVIWDTDKLYWENSYHEAGHFIKKFYSSIGREFDLPDHLSSHPKRIDITSAPTMTLQAKWCAQELVKAVEENKIEQTALILADENLLVPILNNLPVHISKANITLGMPLKKTAVRSFLHSFFEVKSGFKRFNTKAVYYKFILQFIQHPFIQAWVTEENITELNRLEKNLIQTNRSFINASNVNFKDEKLNELFQLFFGHQKLDGLDLYQNIIQLFELLFARLKENESPIQAEICYLFTEKILELKDTLKDLSWKIDLNTLQKIIDLQYQSESISFFGSPTKGLQIMGVLESRMLDFKHLIVVGMNEGSLPAKNFSTSMIPMDLKIHHGLPTPHEKEAIFSHHFYRLLHRAESLAICYSTDAETNAEKSRYLRQIENELPKRNPDLIVTNSLLKTDISASNTTSTPVQNNEAIQTKLDVITQRGISPSAINTFRRCTKNFYYRYILGIKEQEGVEEQIESSTFGTIVHETLEHLYLPFIGKQLHTHDVEEMLKKVDLIVNERFAHYFPDKNYMKGKNRLSFNTSLFMVKKFLKQEIEFLKHTNEPLLIIALEEELSYETEVEINGKMKSIKFKGNADRIDRVGEHLRIIDYKTGSCDPSKVKFGRDKNMDGLLQLDDKKTFPLQLLLYFLMYHKAHPHIQNMTSGIISMRNASNGLMNVVDPISKSDLLNTETATEFEEVLLELIQKMYDNDLLFEHNEKALYCEYC